MPASFAGPARPRMLAAAVASPAIQRPVSCSFAAEARPVVVDRADEVLPDHGGPVLVTLRPRPVVLPEEELEQSQ